MDGMVPRPSDGGKPSFRKAYRDRLKAFCRENPGQSAMESAELVDKLEGWLGSWAEVVLAVLPLDDEPDLEPLYARWLGRGGRLALARTGAGASMNFHEVKTLEGPWEFPRTGLRAPLSALPVWRPGLRTVCLVPGLAFSWDQGAWRLGRGGGYFDRWLGAHRQEVFTMGYGFSVSGAEAVPRDPWDQKLDGLALAGQPILLSASPAG